MTYRVLVTPISDRVLPPLMWSGPFTRRSDALANVAFWQRLGSCSARIEMGQRFGRISTFDTERLERVKREYPQ